MGRKTNTTFVEPLDDQISAQCGRRMRLRLQRLAAGRGNVSESAVIREAIDRFLSAEEERLGLAPLALPAASQAINDIIGSQTKK